jgi:hypothetical protein
MNVDSDPLIATLNPIVGKAAVAEAVRQTLRKVLQELDASERIMAWDTVPLAVFGDDLPQSIRSCWVFAIRANAATGAERHPNSHQRSLSLAGQGTFELRAGGEWTSHPLVSIEPADLPRRWVSIPPSTWHRLFTGSAPWGMLSFHTVAPEDLIEERPVNENDLDGETHQKSYVAGQ